MPTESTDHRQRASRDYASEPQQIVLTLILALIDTWPEPQTPTTLAARTGYSRDQVYRGLCNLALQRMAEDSPAGWVVGPLLTAAAERIRQRIASLLAQYLGSPA
jgi:DNA-binding IclR family transcriptional regulator